MVCDKYMLYFVLELSQNSGAVFVSPDATDLCSSIRLSSFLPRQTFISSQEFILHHLKYKFKFYDLLELDFVRQTFIRPKNSFCTT